ncbi:hypothetical protein ACQP2F_27060 [Actinoplanes sp. CA-030573]|uniref:hypothetical protein n=1 Tax=Actinoplanes sp. CA-030573 TaxID=3239898 RepID=UPI003D920146
MVTAPLPVLWAMRPVESARVNILRRDGVTVVDIQHAPLRGVTPSMISWWFRHLAGDMTYAGTTCSRFLVWHPLDHLGCEVDGTRLHLTEALQRDPGNALDLRVEITEMHENRAVIAKEVAGTSLVRMVNEFTSSPLGARFATTMTIGDDSLLGRVALNQLAHRRAGLRIRPWIRHHIEEIGNLENFLPGLIADKMSQEP